MDRVFCYVKSKGWLSSISDCDSLKGLVLMVEGDQVSLELQTQGPYLEDWLDLLPLTDQTGLMVWEGKDINDPTAYTRDGYEAHFVGEWRRPTPHELRMLASNIKEPATVP